MNEYFQVSYSISIKVNNTPKLSATLDTEKVIIKSIHF